MELVDAHCHFDFPQFDGRRPEILRVLSQQGITHLVIPGVRRADWARVVETASIDSRLSFCLGIHPWYVGEHTEADLEELHRLLSNPGDGCVGLGECGLDRLRGDMAGQLPWFEHQVVMADELSLPLVVHSVKAHDEVCAVLRARRPQVPVLIHGFAGSGEQAKKLVGLGCYIGVGGIITHERARKTRAAIAGLPVSALVLETDAPDMAPAGIAKGQNSPVYLSRILDELTRIRQEPAPALAESLLRNVRQVFGWDKGISK